MVDLQRRLAAWVAELEAARGRVATLEGLLPICAWCKRVRGGGSGWQPVDDYLRDRAGTPVTHSICPSCADQVLQEGERACG